MITKFVLILSLILLVNAQSGSNPSGEASILLPIQKCTSPGSCTTESYRLVLDANYRGKTCTASSGDAVANGCSLQSADTSSGSGYAGVSVTGNAVTLNNQRLYFLNPSTNLYKQFNLLAQEIRFTVDVSQLGCSDISALYLVSMQADGTTSSRNTAGAPYGTGYCDAQCLRSYYVDGYISQGSAGACCSEMDVWEGNSKSNALTTHSCGAYRDCGLNQYACQSDSSSVCDASGCQVNPYQEGYHNFYGPSSSNTINTLDPVTVVTEFHTSTGDSSGTLTSIQRYYIQNGVVIGSPVNITSCTNSLATFGQAISANGGMVMVLSTFSTGNDFLDGGSRGTCGDYTQTISPTKQPVVFSNIKYGPIGSTSSGSSSSTTGATVAAAATTTAATTGGATTGTAATASSSGSTTNPPPSNYVYTDSLASSWTDYSSATRNFGSTTTVHAGTYSISFGLSNYQQLYFHTSSSFTIGTLPYLQFYVNGGSLSLSNALWVQFYDSSMQPTGSRYTVSVTANQWNVVNVNALAASPAGCGLASSTTITGFVIQYTGSDSPGTIYVDDIVLSGSASTTGSATTGATVASATTGSSATVGGSSSTGGSGCSVYTVSAISTQSSWTTGAVYQFTITNTGSSAPSSLVLAITVASGDTISNPGNMVSSGGNHYTVNNPSSFTASSTETYTFEVDRPAGYALVTPTVTVYSC